MDKIAETSFIETADISKCKLWYKFLRRFQDIFFSSFAIIILSPVMLVTAIVVVIDDPHGGPIFRQERVGKDGKTFTMYKFRSMYVNAEEQLESLLDQNDMDGPAFKLKNDPRITRVGRFIRKTSIDELPQLFNVFMGNMSIVGPRPSIAREVENYNSYHMQRLKIKPGMTCYWQIQPQRNDIPFDEWIALDIKYINNRSFTEDWKIIFKTFSAVLTGQGI